VRRSGWGFWVLLRVVFEKELEWERVRAFVVTGKEEII
jgi:hypothetical protein